MSFLGTGLSLLETLGQTASDTLVRSILQTAGKSVGLAAVRSMGAALPYIDSGLRLGLSGNEIQRVLETAGIGVNRANLLGVIKVFRTQYGYPSYIPGVNSGEYPGAELFRFAIGRYQKQYNVVLSIHLRNPKTGDEDTAHLTLSSDSLPTLDEIDNAVLAYGPSLEGTPTVSDEFAGFDQTIGYSIDQVNVSPQ